MKRDSQEGFSANLDKDIFIFTSPLQIHSSLKPIVIMTGLEMTACQNKMPEIVDKSGHSF